MSLFTAVAVKATEWLLTRADLEALARPTLRALSLHQPYHGRSLERLFLDGGTETGFLACKALGWADFIRNPDSRIRRVEGERMINWTEKGREAWKKISMEAPSAPGK